MIQKKSFPITAFVRIAEKLSKDCSPRDLVPPLFLMQTQQLIKERHSLASILLDQCIKNLSISDIAEKIFFKKCPIVVISTESNYIEETLELSSKIKKKLPRGICIVVGHAATYCTNQLVCDGSPIHYAIRGEYQILLSEIIEKISLSQKNMNSYINDGTLFSADCKKLSKINIISNIDDLPLVAYSQKDMRQYPNIIPLPLFKSLLWGRIFTTYGCPNRCTFCTQTIRMTYGSHYRRRAIDGVINDIIRLQQSGANIIEFSDDNFTSSKTHVKNLCNAIITHKIKVRWGTHVRADDVDYQTLSLMRKAGCLYIRCGVESGSPKILGEMMKTKNIDTWNEKVKDFFAWSKKLGITTIAYTIFGMPNERLEDVKKTKDLILAIEPDLLKTHSLCIYPGSKAYETMRNHALRKEQKKLSHHSSYAFHENAEKWQELENDLLRTYYFRIKYLAKHCAMFSGFYLCNLKCTIVLLRYVFRITKECFFKKNPLNPHN